MNTKTAKENTGAAQSLPTQNGSDCFMDKFDEPASAYTLRKVLTNQFKCKCFDGMWCYAKGNQRPCDAGLISQNIELDGESASSSQ
jgi:hypothetical protein